MNRASFLGLLLLCFATSCQMPPERLPLKALPEDNPPLPYAELLTRARLQAAAATEAFYVSRWSDLEDSAKGLQQTARFFPRAIEVPAKHKENLATEAKALENEANVLLQAVVSKDVKQSNESLQRLNLRIRELRLED